MPVRLFWISYDRKPFQIKDVGLERFENEEDAIKRGETIIKENLCTTCEEENDCVVQRFKLGIDINHITSWHGYEVKLYRDNDDSYLELFKHYFDDND